MVRYFINIFFPLVIACVQGEAMVSDADYVTGHLADFFYSSSWSVGSHGFSMNTLRSVLRVTRSYSLVGRLSMSISGLFPPTHTQQLVCLCFYSLAKC